MLHMNVAYVRSSEIVQVPHRMAKRQRPGIPLECQSALNIDGR